MQPRPCPGDFCGRHVLLLQGPVGPFFSRLARDLKNAGAVVHKINFNGGDRAFYSAGEAVDYTGTLDQWPAFLRRYVHDHEIDTILLYGDCRPVHDVVFDLFQDEDVEIFSFEEGYIRPLFVTFERGRVNGQSRLPRDSEWYRQQPLSTEGGPGGRDPNTFWHMAWWGIGYHVFAHLYRHRFPNGHALYHRGLGLEELWPQVRSLLRKGYHALRDWPASRRLMQHGHGRYFFVPLQVATDSQVFRYSRYGDPRTRTGRIEDFIRDVMQSFARHAPSGTMLVLKHHPMDRGYRHYGRFIRETAREMGIARRVTYLVKNVPTPQLINHSLGVVVINSTVGLQAVLHGRPVKVLGEAIYDMPGLTASCGLDAFWTEAESHVPDRDLVQRFEHFLKRHCLIRGSFFRRLPESSLHCGLVWPGEESASRAQTRKDGQVQYRDSLNRVVVARDAGGGGSAGIRHVAVSTKFGQTSLL